MENVQLIYDAHAGILEGPEWNAERKCISCVSIEEGLVNIIYEESGKIVCHDLGSQVGCAVWKDKDNLLAATYDGIFLLNADSGEKTYVTNLLPDKKLRYNDGTLDAKGRFLVGTTGYNCLSEKFGFLYSYTEESLKTLEEKVTISNGICFSPDNEIMYYIDTPTQKVGKYDYNLQTGEASFDKYIVDIDKGLPDGMCSDSDGNIWVAHWGGYCVSKWNPQTGEKLQEIELECMNVSSCCIGGVDNDYLYITTAKHDDNTESEEHAGGLFKVYIGK